MVVSSSAQDALRLSLAGQQALLARERADENQPYTFRAGDFKVLAGASLTGQYDDNISISETKALDDFIVTPMLNLDASYPITSKNLLRLNLGVGYDWYTQNDQYSILRLESGSQISFDMYVQDVWINLHDRFRYTQDPGQEASIANTGRYGGFDNMAGISATWDLQDLILTLGYDHQNFISTSRDFEYLNRGSELLVGRAGFQVQPRLIAGVEGSGSFTRYDQPVLNDNAGYSAGVYAEWKPGNYFRLTPRAGYAAYLFDQTSRYIKAVDIDAWYADLTLTHDITDAISYSISAGHEIRLGINADAIEDTYVRPSFTWRIIKNLTLGTSLSYETGEQGRTQQYGSFSETYDWLGSGLSLGYLLTRRLAASLSYRHTLRSSNSAPREYDQNVVTLRFNYAVE